MELTPLLLLAPALVAVAYCDLRYMKIPNALVMGALALFVVTAPMLGWSELGARVAAGASVLAVGFVLFAMRLFGGGDVKMMAALMLFVPSQTYTLFGLGFSAAMMAGIGIVLALRTVPALAGSSWVGLQQRGTFPMGISIAMTGLAHPVAIAILT
ncbi:prepilin peptidase [Roseibacterium sp. SDUM158017]|uniref:A24 family peptidase n=1 Tax=Roseicyclus salinarum TaxID=3036773 RepID=UPI0024152F3A|nr:prepilin peptidase [Roseibacterium sp. SDUM158017]MDG4647341.1 prepilin peptidase [Roseibacterium sp. SDUM158017]